ncbi:MAG: hypothetical protein WHS90_14285 [Caldilinea sp.]|uniref:hypothetical protein n=1 Tax=Caldilinea sp. TaxID=2293560 RepID=UPI0030B4D871
MHFTDPALLCYLVELCAAERAAMEADGCWLYCERLAARRQSTGFGQAQCSRL